MMTARSIARRLCTGAAPLALLVAGPACARSADALAELRAEIAALRAEQRASAARIAQLEAAQAQAPRPLAAAPASAPVLASPSAEPAPSPQPGLRALAQGGPAAPINPAGGSGPGALPVPVHSKLTINGDLRARYEHNFGDRDGRDRDRMVMRARLRGVYAVNRWLTIGGQLTTGDPNDPNSTDSLLSGFDNDLQVSLDQAYLRASAGGVTAAAGKIPLPFVRTELIWDGDVNPEGFSASYRLPLGAHSTLRANALYFIVDEAPTAADSHMVGGQVQFESEHGPLRVELAAGYYDYALRSLTGADAGDFRTNRVTGGVYLSDFNLLDVIAAVQFNGLGERWPVRIVGDYVHNYGATTTQDSGFGVDLILGRAAKKGDWRLGYGYAELGVDAVLAAFSHDNTDLATNYLQHTLFAETMVVPNVVLNVTYYRYRPKSALYTTSFLPDDWLNRLRVAMLVNF